jgi:hypothetical protein
MHRGCVLLILLFVLVTALQAQTTDTSSIYGLIVDPNHAAVAGASVIVTNSVMGLKRTATTDSGGRFAVGGLPVAGEYEIMASMSGFAEARTSKLKLAAGTTASVVFQLEVAEAQAEITVSSVLGEVRTDSPQLGNLLDARLVEATPLINNRVTYLTLLNAANRQAINQGDAFMNQNLFTANGAGRRQTWFEVDGSTGNDSWGRQTMFSNLPAAAVEEITILENEFSAEYGGSTGSAVNIVTQSGGEKLHGEVRESWRPAGTEAALSGFNSSNAASGNDITSDTLGQSDVSLSGPMFEGLRSHFFIAAELSREDRSSPIISPIAPGSYVGHYRGWLGFARLDHQINERNTLFFRSDIDAFHDTNPNGIVGGNSLPTVARVFHRRTYTAAIGETSVLSGSLLNNLRAQFQLASPITQFQPQVYGTQYTVPISTGGTFTSGTSQSALLMNRQYQISETLSKTIGRHQIKFGGNAIVAHTGGDSKEFGGPIYLGQFVYNVCTQSLSVCESPAFLQNIANVKTYTQSYGRGSYTVNDTLWTAFVEDEYRARPDLTLNLGLRYEQQTFTDSRQQFAPRVGFAYSVGGGRMALRGGFGIYYSQVVDNSEANYALMGPTGVFNYTASPGQTGFPVSVAAAPLPTFPQGAVVPLRTLYVRPGSSAYLDHFFPTNTLIGYQTKLLNPYSEQWTFGIERRLGENWVMRVDYVGSHTLRINRPLDVDPSSPFVRSVPGQTRTPQEANCTRPYWIWWYGKNQLTCNPNTATNPQPPYAVIQSDVNDGYAYYDALNVNLSHRLGNGLSLLASYTWSHTIDNVDPDVASQNPNDPNFTGKVENGSAIFDQRQRLVLSGFYLAPIQITMGGIFTAASGLPYNFVTGTTNSGDTGATADRPVINRTVVGRNMGRGTPIYDFAPFIERTFGLGDQFRLIGRVESFNVFNHANMVGFSGTYGNGATPGPGFGAPLVGITNQLPARSVQFSLKLTF